MPDLQQYARKRNFDKTPEPSGTPKRSRHTGKAYVIQKHDARNLHYDFRLELDGVLLSWAVPKGPSLNPSTKRLAMQTEDHPLEYRDFEGVIPKGQYGGGTVMVWDNGTWEPIGDARKGYKKGHLKFKLHGEKLQGDWHLVRRGDDKSWLLFKSRDDHAESSNGTRLLKEKPQSVLTGRDLDAIAEDSDRVWRSKSQEASDSQKSGENGESGAKKPKSRKASGSQSSKRATSSRSSHSGDTATAEPAKRYQVELTHPDRVLYAEQGITKRELANYYIKVASWMLPHVENRILTLVRCPEGDQKECFYQKHSKAGMPEHVLKTPIKEKNKNVDYMRIEDAAGLVSLVQLGVLEIHTWGAHADRPDRPDQLVFDLDPGAETEWQQVIDGARMVRDTLAELGLESFLKTSGSKGLHVVAPVERRLDWETTKAFCKAVAEQVSHNDPEKYLATMSKSKRRGKIFIDYLRNGRGATSVCAYSARARSNAPVSTPVAWHELSPRLSPAQFDIRNLPQRLSRLKHDPWDGFYDLRQSITKQMRRSVGLDV